MKTVEQLISMQGKVALITGASGHLGRVMADALAQVGASLILVDRDDVGLKALEQDILSKYSITVLSVKMDMEQESEIKALPSVVGESFNKIDVIINNAAFVGSSGLTGWVTDFENQSSDTWRRAIEVNLTAPFLLIQSCLPLMNSGHSVSIINIGSIYGILGPDMSLYADTTMGNPAAYAASKGGLLQFSRWASTVLAPNVRVNMITPGGIARNQDPKFSERYTERTPLGRMATEEDFVGAVVFLSSNLSSYITGQNIVVDGGWSVW